MLKEEGISCKEEKNEFPGCAEKQKKEDLKVMQTFTLLCLAIAVICGMLNYLMLETLNWFWFAAAGCICAWLIVYVAYMKRRSILKNEMWQLVIAAVAGVLWDVFTGWRGWSVDYLLPLASLAVICSMWVITAVQKLEVAEYMIYLLEAGAFGGVIPVILLAAGVVTVLYPSLICICVSFLMLVWLFLFKRKDMVREMQKKFRA